ncbi:MAG: DsbA family oxidoreductase [Gammaproteobacteria bacterium]|jgi:predicted DsbA family dithiol-disulfide isomerase
MRIEVFSDVICPWCFVGHARLQQALAARADRDIEVQWLPFELNSAMPVAGRNRREYLLERFGRPDPFAAGQQQLLELGGSLGIAFDFEAIERAPNTRRAHALAAAAWRSSPQTQAKVIRALFVAYFTEGRDVGDPAVLEKIGVDAGMPAVMAAAALDDANLHTEIVALEALAQRSQITGVPTFIFDRKQGFSGAQPLESFLQVIDALTAPAQ